MSRYLIYNTKSGQIEKVVITPDTISEKIKVGQQAIFDSTGNANDESHYVDLANTEIQERKTVNPGVSTVTSKVTLSRLPDPCNVTWQRQTVQAAGGKATITFDEPGTYSLKLEGDVAYQPTEIEVQIP